MTASLEVLAGERHGELTCTGEVIKMQGGRRMWRCVCDCGMPKDVLPGAFRSGKNKSCGNHPTKLAIESARSLLQAKAKYPKDTGAGTKLYRAWRAMKSRCTVPSDDAYKRYGVLGVTLCAEWHDYEPFRVWSLNNGFGEGLSIDRIDTFGGYTPGNCRWVTMVVQARNKRKPCHELTAFGETMLEVDWANDERCVVKQSTLRERVRLGWPPERALTEPSELGHTRAHRDDPKNVPGFGELKTVAEWARDTRCAVSESVLRERLKRGTEFSKAMALPKTSGGRSLANFS